MARWAGMRRSDPPSGDVALLVGLSAAVSAMIGFGLMMYWLMQPTVLPNTPFDMADLARRAPIVLRATPATHPPDIAQAAIDTAARENEIQGLRPALAARTEPAPTQAHAQATVKAAKPKRAVARAPRRDAEAAYASNWWGGRQSHFFGGFGNWHRW
jgi:hypothetical protein